MRSCQNRIAATTPATRRNRKAIPEITPYTIRVPAYRSGASFAPSPNRIVPITASIGLRSFA